MNNVPVATVKKKFSEYVSTVEIKGSRVVISRRNKPVAALICMEDLELLNSRTETAGLADAIGKWKEFGEIEKDVKRAYRTRRDDGERKVSL